MPTAATAAVKERIEVLFNGRTTLLGQPTLLYPFLGQLHGLRQRVAVGFDELLEVGSLQSIHLTHLQRHHTHRAYRFRPKEGDRTEVCPIDQMAQLDAIGRVDGGRSEREKVHGIGCSTRRQYRVLLQVQLKPELIGDVLQDVQGQLAKHVRPAQERSVGDLHQHRAAQVIRSLRPNRPHVEVVHPVVATEMAAHLPVDGAPEPFRPAERIDLVQDLVVPGAAGVGGDDRPDQQQQDVGGPNPTAQEQQRLGPLVQEVMRGGERMSTLEANLERDHHRAEIAIGDGGVVLEIAQPGGHVLRADGTRRDVVLEVGAVVGTDGKPLAVGDRVVEMIPPLILTPEHIDQKVRLEAVVVQQDES
uniref:Uncharacterized protein n=1 Tax=Anopheles farauti TaxID=69004 RepID=A0A182Q0H0_9DIPT